MDESSNAKERVQFLLSHVCKEEFIFYCLKTQKQSERFHLHQKPISRDQRLQIVQDQLDQMIKVGFTKGNTVTRIVKILNLESQWNIFLAAKDSRFGLCYKCDSYFLHLRFKLNTFSNLTLFKVNLQWKIVVRSSISYRTLEPGSGRPIIDVAYATKEKILRLVNKLILTIWHPRTIC